MSSYERMKVTELKLLADDRGIEYKSKATKPELIALHTSYDQSREAARMAALVAQQRAAEVAAFKRYEGGTRTPKLEPLALVLNYARANARDNTLTLAECMGVKLTVRQRRAIRRRKRLFDNAETLGLKFKEVRL